jgi:hypothetical protein
VEFILPAALSSYLTKTAPAFVHVLPTELQDLSVSTAPGEKLSYLGYEFEVPWDDLDQAQTKQLSRGNSGTDSAWIFFRSGLKMLVTAAPADEASSDYALAKLVYEFSPDKTHIWPPFPSNQYRQLMLLTSKSHILSNDLHTPAESGIFNLRTPSYHGFQLGNPQVRQDGLRLELYSDNGSFKITFLQEGYEEPAGVTQPDLNRIVQSLHKISPASPIAER